MERNIYKIENNLYVTSDEEIKKDSWVIKDNKLMYLVFLKVNSTRSKEGALKVILSTDPTLIADDVQEIDDTFLEWFVKNPSCDYVEVKMEKFGVWRLGYKVITPQEEPNQETLTETAENFAKTRVDALKDKKEWNPDCIYHEAFNGYIVGSTETPKRMNSDEDMIAFMQFIISNPDLCNTSSVSETTARYYLEQFKNK